MEPEQSPSGEDARTEASIHRATLAVADAIGELMGFWNFKPSMGRVWVVLFLSDTPLCAEEIAEAGELSAGSVSMTIHELLQWGVIRRAHEPGERRRRFVAETDVLGMITRVFRERELRLIEEVVRRLEDALRELQGLGSVRPEVAVRVRFLVGRVEQLLGLARAGRAVVARFAQAGTLDLRGIRAAIGRG